MSMDKKRLFQILNRLDSTTVAALSAGIQKDHRVTVIKQPEKTLAMIKLREPVKNSLFYLGEALVCEAHVEIGGGGGCAVAMGDDADKTLNMAIIDAAVNKGVFADMDVLLEAERRQQTQIMRENAMHLKTMVSFQSMDQEVPGDVSAYKKAQL